MLPHLKGSMVTLRRLFKPTITIQYPDEETAQNRGRLRCQFLVVRRRRQSGIPALEGGAEIVVDDMGPDLK